MRLACIRTYICFLACLAGPALAERAALSSSITFEDLANTPVTTVGRKEQRYVSTPAAVYVLTREEFNSSGGVSIVDALRLAPGIHVGQINAHSWGVSVRGFNSLHADKVVVLIDNRSVYTPLWSGVYWEQHEWLADDIERIEVVRGPGGSKWGTNAVNGAINIFTRSARDTQGLALTGGAGDEERAFGSVRYGTQLGESGWIRGFAGHKERDDSAALGGGEAQDSWRMTRGGVRYDADFGDSQLRLQGGAFTSDLQQNIRIPSTSPPYSERLPDGKSDGAHVQGQWTHRSTRTGRITLHAFYDRSDRDVLASSEVRHTFDLEAQQVIDLGEMHQLAWGLGYRQTSDRNENNLAIAITPQRETRELFSAFAEDEITAPALDMAFTIGAKLEHNDTTGWEVQPSVRAAWSPTPLQTMWSAVSRAVRRPSRMNEGLIGTAVVAPPGASGPRSPTTLVQVSGNPSLDAETVLTYETGWRAAAERRSFDVTAFYSTYEHLIGFGDFVLDADTLAPEFWRLISQQQNFGSGHGYGAEAAVSWTPADAWTLHLNYSFLRLHLTPSDPLNARTEGSSPRHMATFRSAYTPTPTWRFDVAFRYVDKLESLSIPDYFTADVGVTRRLTEQLDLALIGRNLLQGQHPEFVTAEFVQATEVERSVFLRLSWRTE